MDLASLPQLKLAHAQPYPFSFPLASTALILIDLQRDFLEPGGFGEIQCHDAEIFNKTREIVPTVQRLLEAFRSFDGHVIHTREGHRPNLADLPASKLLRQKNNPDGHDVASIGDPGPMGRLLVRGEYGHDIVDELTPWPGEDVVDKPGKGSFWSTSLHRILLARGVTHLIFAGVTTECCVSTTLRECSDRGYECCVLEDCTAGFDPDLVKASLNNLSAYGGLFGYVSSCKDFFDAMDAVKAVVSAPVTPPDLTKGLPSMDELHLLYKSGTIRPAQIVNFIYDKIERYSLLNPAVWISVQSREQCIKAAVALETLYAGKPLPPLYGVPFSVKDTMDVAGVVTTAACPQYAYTARTTAVSVQYILDAGGIFIGKVNHDQFATGLSGCRSPYGTPHSFFSRDHIAGGSSSGSAVSVAAGLVSFALATDTAGSGRVPAGLNGVLGLKPTKGTISARGLVPAIRTLDTISVMAPTVAEARRVWRILAIPDPLDHFSKLPHTLPTWPIDFRGPREGGFTFAVPPISSLMICSPEYQDMFAQAVQVIQSCGGHLVHHIDFTIFERAGNLLYDASMIHARMTCIGEDFLKDNINDLHPVIRKLFLKAIVKPPSAWDVLRDQTLQVELTRKAQLAFDTLRGEGTESTGVDVLIVPTTTRHPTIHEMECDPLALNAQLGTFTHCANVVDLSGVSVPAGRYIDEKSGAELPFGITLLGGSGQDAKVLDVAAVIESAVGALRRRSNTSAGNQWKRPMPGQSPVSLEICKAA